MIELRPYSGKEIAYIYALVDPRDSRVRYVGKTLDVKKRYYEHRCNRYGPVGSWCSELRSTGLLPEIVVLEVVPEPNWPEAERKWIAHYREIEGRRLLNIHNGGRGPAGPYRKTVVITPELRKKLGDHTRGIPKSPEHRAKISAAMRGRRPEAALAKLKALTAEGKNPNIGSKHTAETREKISQALKGQPHPWTSELLKGNEYGKTSFLGRRHTEETKERLRQIRFEWWKNHRV